VSPAQFVPTGSDRRGILAKVRNDRASLHSVASLELASPDRLERITIGPLSIGALHTVISERLKQSFPRPTMIRIHEVSGGNPLYAIELARALDGHVASAEVGLSDTLASLMHARIDSLDVEARIGFLSSVVRTHDGLAQLADRVAPFILRLTVECFSRRDLLLKASKASLDNQHMPEVLRRAQEHGLGTSFTYIVGLDPLDEIPVLERMGYA